MNAQETIQYKARLVWDSVRGEKKPQRIPHMNNYWSWKITDAGYKLSEATHDNNKMIDVMKQWVEKYPEFDITYETGHRNPLLVEEAIGVRSYIVNDEANVINILDQCTMEADEYDELIADMKKFYWTKAMPRRSSTFSDASKEEQKAMLAESIKQYKEFNQMQGKVFEIMKEHGTPRLAEAPVGFNGIEFLFNYLRGIKGLSIDLRRQYDKVKEANEVISAQTLTNYSKLPNLHKGIGDRDKLFAFDTNICMLVHTILNPKQFEELFWPTLKYMADYVEEYDKVAFIFQEGTGDRFWDMFRDLPAGRFAYYSENDDIYKMKAALPNITPGGGFPQGLLANGTKQECCDKAKQLIDELGADGKYIIGANKMMSFPGDAKSENLKAVCEFVDQYTIA